MVKVLVIVFSLTLAGGFIAYKSGYLFPKEKKVPTPKGREADDVTVEEIDTTTGTTHWDSIGIDSVVRAVVFEDIDLQTTFASSKSTTIDVSSELTYMFSSKTLVIEPAISPIWQSQGLPALPLYEPSSLGPNGYRTSPESRMQSLREQDALNKTP